MWSIALKNRTFNAENRLKRRFSEKGGPSDRIRTCGILLPKQARYQLRYTRLFRYFIRLVVFSQSRRATNCATPRYIWFFYFVIFAKHSITIRCASLKNIVALLAWSASHCSLFFHLRASPESSAGRGEPLRPTALHPDIFDFLLCCSGETQHNNPLFARKCIEFRLNA